MALEFLEPVFLTAAWEAGPDQSPAEEFRLLQGCSLGRGGVRCAAANGPGRDLTISIYLPCTPKFLWFSDF